MNLTVQRIIYLNMSRETRVARLLDRFGATVNRLGFKYATGLTRDKAALFASRDEIEVAQAKSRLSSSQRQRALAARLLHAQMMNIESTTPVEIERKRKETLIETYNRIFAAEIDCPITAIESIITSIVAAASNAGLTETEIEKLFNGILKANKFRFLFQIDHIAEVIPAAKQAGLSNDRLIALIIATARRGPAHAAVAFALNKLSHLNLPPDQIYEIVMAVLVRRNPLTFRSLPDALQTNLSFRQALRLPLVNIRPEDFVEAKAQNLTPARIYSFFLALHKTYSKPSIYEAALAGLIRGLTARQVIKLFRFIFRQTGWEAENIFASLAKIYSNIDSTHNETMALIVRNVKKYQRKSRYVFEVMAMALDKIDRLEPNRAQQAEALALVNFFDSFSRTHPNRLIVDHLSNPQTSRLRYLLATENYAAVPAAEPENVVRALCQNHFSGIIHQTANLVLEYGQDKGVVAGMEKEGWVMGGSPYIAFLSFTKDDLMVAIRQLPEPPTGRAVELMLNRLGFRYFEYRGKTLIIPLVHDILLSGYRGSVENDAAEAQHLTHALDSALLFSHPNTEAHETRSGSTAFHEFDLGLLALTEEIRAEADRSVSLGFHRNGIPLPGYARKRTVCLQEESMSTYVGKLLDWQFKERVAKQNLSEILHWIEKGVLSAEELTPAIQLAKTQLCIMQKDCHLNSEYYRAIYGTYDDSFFAVLTGSYVSGQNNRSAFDSARGKKFNLLNYLENETRVRAGTFEEIDVRTVSLETIRAPHA